MEFLNKNKLIFSSESVGSGHPDKICDQISDSILDSYLKEDKKSRVACEVFANNRLIIIGGEVNSIATNINVVDIAWKVLLNLGYTKNDFTILSNINIQSPNIAQTIEKQDNKIGAGDQGIVFGYATNETKEYLPISVVLAHKILENIELKIRNKIIDFLGFDMKSQVSVSYENNSVKIETFLVSIQHKEDYDKDKLETFVSNEMINIAKAYNLNTNFQKIINPSGIFVIGGPIGDTGLTGRKIIVDTYGGAAKHGGGAFSGKDPTKIDRSGAYFCRYIAKNIVAAGLADKCEIQLGFAIGITHPISIHINTFNTSKFTDDEILQAVNKVFNFDISSFINELNLYNVEYKKTAVYGHFGKDFSWEKLNKVNELKNQFLKK